MPTIFKTISWPVEHLVNGIASGSIQLPDLQRPFVWPKAKIRDLLDSMYRGYPVGELMFWDVAAVGETRSIANGAAQGAAHQIVDGQQRLTSLYAALRGKPVPDAEYRPVQVAIAFNPFTEKFEVATPAIERSPQWIGNIARFFDNPFQARRAFMKRYEIANAELDDAAEERLDRVFADLQGIVNYGFDVVHILEDVDKRTVADIFVRINSEGVSLKAYDYMLTWLSVFWPEGREAIENFARDARVTPERASEIAGRRVPWTPKNHYIAPDAGHIVRALIALGPRRAKLVDAYNALQARDRVTGAVDSARQEQELSRLKAALPVVLRPLHWDEFLNSFPGAGFRSRKGVTSSINVISSYVLWVLGREIYKVGLSDLRVLIARWLLMSQLTNRYTGSGETQLQKDLDRLEGVAPADADGFSAVLEDELAANLNEDYWTNQMPRSLVTSSTALSPHYQAYLAALNVLGADMFMLDMSVQTWMDPTINPVKGLEGHHLFPRAYQEQTLGTSDLKVINQVANFAPTDWATNIAISDDPPSVYWSRLLRERSRGAEWLAKQQYWHALPEGWAEMPYESFLAERRRLMAAVTRDAYRKLSNGAGFVPPVPEAANTSALTGAYSLQTLLERSILSPGDLLDPVDPNWAIDAVVGDDGTLLIEGVHRFDDLDDAARFVGVSNINGIDFWAWKPAMG